MDPQELKYKQMTESKVEPLICKLAIPCIISMLVTSFYNMADTFFVGMLKSNAATGAVGVVFSMMAIIQAVGFFFGHGSGNYSSRQLGEKNYKEASNMAATGFFTAIGAAKGAQYSLGPVGIMLCATLSAVGGGILRDVMARKIPTVLTSDFYATASLLGGGLYVILAKTHMPPFSLFASVALAVVIIRLLAIHFRIRLPKARRKLKNALE